MPKQPGGPGTARARMRLGAVLLLALLAGVLGVVAVRLYFAPPTGPAASVAALLALPGLIDAIGYGLAARWVAQRKRWGHFVAIGLIGINLVLSVSAGMSLLDWTIVGANLVTLGLLLASIPGRPA